jgi:hypothetical protein
MRRLLALALLASSSCGARSELEALDQRDPEVCNGRDDDGDGQIDEEIEELSCGEGACAATAPGCVDGQVGSCIPGAPSPEICNGIDDDCDGAIDDELGFGLIAGPYTVAQEMFEPTGLVATERGLLAAWTRSFDGSNPTPNAFTRVLDDLGAPAAPPEQLLPQPVSLGVGPSLAPAADGRFVAAMCRRFGANDYPSWIFLDAEGAPLGAEHVVQETSENCTTYGTPPQMLWTGERHLFTWITSTSDKVFLEASDADGSGAAVDLLVDGADLSAPPRLTQHDDRVALVLGLQPPVPQESELGVILLDPGGEPQAAPIAMPDPGGTRYLQPRVAVGSDGHMMILATHRFDPGWMRARVSFDGTVLLWPVLEPEELQWGDLRARSGGGFWAVAMLSGGDESSALVRLDGEGEIVEMLSFPELGWWPLMALRAGRVHVLYTAPDAPLPNELHSITFGCLP